MSTMWFLSKVIGSLKLKSRYDRKTQETINTVGVEIQWICFHRLGYHAKSQKEN